LGTPVTPTRFAVQGIPIPEPGRYPVAAIASVDGQFFRTMGIPILSGRTFHPEEVGNLDQEHCIVNDTLVRTYFNGQNPLGRTILTNVAAPAPEPCEIVGVVGDTRLASLDATPGPMLYFTSYVAKELLVVRTTIDPLAVAPSIQRELTAADPEQPLSGIQTMDEIVLQSISSRSFAGVLLVCFAGLGLILASLGLYGVLSYSVAQRTQEIGVRMALGADRSSVLRLIIARGLRVTAVGLVAGVIAAAGAARIMSSLVLGIGAGDILTFVVGCSILLVVATIACLIPARRATKIDPLTALRIE
jgi:putative ABC transport system permease protein